MIDIDSLQEYVEAAKEYDFVNEPCGMTYSQADEIFTRLRQAEKDAARYRWLRDECRHEYGVDDLFDGSSDSIDKRIDAAMIEE